MRRVPSQPHTNLTIYLVVTVAAVAAFAARLDGVSFHYLRLDARDAVPSIRTPPAQERG